MNETCSPGTGITAGRRPNSNRMSFRKSDCLITAILVAATGFLFQPVFAWIARETLAHEQLRQSLSLMLFAAIFVVFDKWGKLKPAFELSNANLAFLILSFILATSTFLFRSPYIILAALGLAVLALSRIVFGSRALPIYLPFAITFGAFLLFILFFPVADWPLRVLAGRYASQILEQIGVGATLAMLDIPAPVLLMLVEEQTFEVAAECNGFGVISTSLLLSLLLTVSRNMPLWWKAAGVALAGGVGFGFNIARIICIVLLAPYFPDHYDVMHETVGLIALFGALGAVWLLIGGGEIRKKPK